MPKAIIAADFFIVATATFRLVYVLVVMEIGTRRILHVNVTPHPTALWTLQQFRECVTGDEGYRFIIFTIVTASFRVNWILHWEPWV